MALLTRMQPVTPLVNELRLPAESSRLQSARRHVERIAVTVGLDRASARRLVYAVNEAVTNAIRHGAPDAQGMIRLCTVIEDERLTVHVHDQGSFRLPTVESGPQAEHGRGFQLMASFADEVILSIRPGATTVSLSVAAPAMTASLPDIEDASRSPSGRARGPRRRAAATLVSLIVALLGQVSLGTPGASAQAPLLNLSIGGASLVSLGGGSSSSSSATPAAPLVGASVLTTAESGGTQLLGASVAGKEVASVNAPQVSSPELPSVPVTGVTTPTTPTSPPAHGSGPSSGNSTGSSSAAASSSAGSGAASNGSASASSAGSARKAAGPAGRRAQSDARAGNARHGGTAARSGAWAPGTILASTRQVSARQLAATGTASSSGGSSSSGNPLDSIGRHLPVPLPVPDWSKPIILALLLLALGLGARSLLATRQVRRLDRQRLGMQRDLDAMQAALVPEIPPIVGGIGVSVAYRPAEGPAAGGDFYDVFMPAPDRVAVILGDVAGHGHEALKQAALARYTLRAYMQAGMAPRSALALAGSALSEPDREQLTTVAIALYDMRRGTLTYALAGHPPPILLGLRALEAPSTCSSPPLGWDLPTGRRQRRISFPMGARACLFSDGLIEARCVPPSGTAHPSLLGRERLRGMLDSLPAGSGAQDLLAAVRSEAQATPDDMAACILTATTPCQEPRIDVEELEVDSRTVEGAHLASFLEACGLAATEVERVLACADAEVSDRRAAVLLVDRSQEAVDVRVVARRADGPARERPAPPSSGPPRVSLRA